MPCHSPALRAVNSSGPLLFAVATFAAVPAFAQSAAQWPDRPVKLVVPVGPGGAADTLARNLSNGFQPLANGQPLIVENRPGGGGTLAASMVVREKPDGYTLFLAEVGANAVAHALNTKLPYDPHTAFTPIIHVANLPVVLLMKPALPYKNLAEFIAAAKQQPGKFNYASAGIGNWTHLFVAYLNRAGRDRRGQCGLSFGRRNDDIGYPRRHRHCAGHGFDQPEPCPRGQGARHRRFLVQADAAVAGHTAGGTDAPRLRRQSLARHRRTGRNGSALVARINGLFNQVLQSPAVNSAITGAQASEVVGGSAQQFDALIKAELKRWPEVVKDAGIKIEQ